MTSGRSILYVEMQRDDPEKVADLPCDGARNVKVDDEMWAFIENARGRNRAITFRNPNLYFRHALPMKPHVFDNHILFHLSLSYGRKLKISLKIIHVFLLRLKNHFPFGNGRSRQSSEG